MTEHCAFCYTTDLCVNFNVMIFIYSDVLDFDQASKIIIINIYVAPDKGSLLRSAPSPAMAKQSSF